MNATKFEPDSTEDPTKDFYTYVNKKWLDSTPIPNDYPRWSSFHVLNEKTEKQLLEIVKDPVNVETKCYKLFSVGMDEESINNRSGDWNNDIKGWFRKFDELAQTKDDLFYKLIPDLYKNGVSGFFSMYADADAKDSEMQRLHFCQSGLGLPDRDYYFDEDKETIRLKYRDHLLEMFNLIGRSSVDVEDIYEIERELASKHQTRVDRRKPELTYNKYTYKEFGESVVQGLDIFRMVGFDDAVDHEIVIVDNPDFFGGIGAVFKKYSLESLKNYFLWKFMHCVSTFLSQDFQDLTFKFYGKTLTGQLEQRPRWKRIMGCIDGMLGEDMGRMYVEKHFSAQSKERVKAMVGFIQDELRERIINLEWMSSKTKKRALEKMESFAVKIGYPDKWKDYTQFEINSESFVDNYFRCARFEWQTEFLDRINQAVDHTRWEMTPQTINAYFHPEMNEIVFPAAILQAPFYDESADPAINFGGIGAIIGHEMTHGYDDQGRKYNANGNLDDWWTPEDTKNFDERAKQIVDQYSQYTVHGQTVNGELTQGENIADLGGLTIAYYALQSFLKLCPSVGNIDGYTQNQRFFMNWARVWRCCIRREEALRLIAIDPHSPSHLRVNGVLYNMREFHEAFGIPSTSTEMYNHSPPKIW